MVPEGRVRLLRFGLVLWAAIAGVYALELDKDVAATLAFIVAGVNLAVLLIGEVDD